MADFRNNKNNNKPKQQNNKPKRQSWLEQNKFKLNGGQINPQEIFNNSDRIIRDLIYGNVEDQNFDYFYNEVIFTTVYNRILFLYQYNWAISVAVMSFITSSQQEIHPSFFQVQSMVKPKEEGYKILLDIFETFRLTGNIFLLKNIPLSLREYRRCL